jgi:hypothetical protein
MAVSMAVLLAATAVAIDGGNAMAQQRGTQNATDAAALAGAVVIGQKFSGSSKTDADVVTAMTSAFAGNSSTMDTSYYVDFSHNRVGGVGLGGAIPSSADGIEAHGLRSFNTFLASMIGQPTWTAGAAATALAGTWQGNCEAASGCGLLPVGFSIPIITCDGTNQPLRPGGQWTIIGSPSQATAANEAIVPLCTTGPGGVGWIDLPGCGGNLADQIWPLCNVVSSLPMWMKTSTGDSNNVEHVINSHYAGTIVNIPMFDATCRDIPATGLPQDCTDPGDGNNLYYHVPQVAQFLLDRAYIQGNNHPECNQSPGTPLVGGNGSTSCFKGWFVNSMITGQVGEFVPCPPGSTDCVLPTVGTQLVH